MGITIMNITKQARVQIRELKDRNFGIQVTFTVTPAERLIKLCMDETRESRYANGCI